MFNWFNLVAHSALCGHIYDFNQLTSWTFSNKKKFGYSHDKLFDIT